MQNTNLLEGEESDNEVMVIGEPTKAAPRELIIPVTIESSPQKLQDEDNQLKELGLFEEGMSPLQKQEILQVVAASRKSAVWEEDNRKRECSPVEVEPGPSHRASLNQEGEDDVLYDKGDHRFQKRPEGRHQVHPEEKESDSQPKGNLHSEMAPHQVVTVNRLATSRINRQQRRNEKDKRSFHEDKERDDQLKELGLYEEGMSRMQKIEILQVIAASRETALQEETLRRQQSKSPPQPASPQPCIALPSSLPSHPPSYAEVCKRDVSKATDCTSHEPKDDAAYISEEELAAESSPATEIRYFAAEHNEPAKQVLSHSQQFSSQDLTEEPDDNSENHPFKDETDDSTNQEDGARSMKGWWGCQSSVPSPELRKPQRLLQKSSLKEAVPYFCPDDGSTDPAEYTSFLVDKFTQFHAQVSKVQSTLLNRCPWGKPIITLPTGPMTRAASAALVENRSNSPPPTQEGLDSLEQHPRKSKSRKQVSRKRVNDSDSDTAPDLKKTKDKHSEKKMATLKEFSLPNGGEIDFIPSPCSDEF